jgi:hypothetical protein
MFTRNVTLKLKPNCGPEFTLLNQNEIIPMLRKQNGFQDEIIFLAPERNEALAISFWDTKENAETYSRTTYPEILKLVARLVEGTPRLETFELSNSTSHKVAVAAA